MDWMYKGPGQSSVDKEEYLLGKPVDKVCEESHRLGGAIVDATPAPLLGRREQPGPSSHPDQVDIMKKVNEDPLVKIKMAERERMKRARDKYMAHNLGNKGAVVAKPARATEEEDSLDAILTEKLNKFFDSTGLRLRPGEGLDELNSMIKKSFNTIKKKLEKSDSSSESSSDDDRRSSKKKKKKRRSSSRSSESSDGSASPELKHGKKSKRSSSKERRKRRSKSESEDSDRGKRRDRRRSPERGGNRRGGRRDDSPETFPRRRSRSRSPPHREKMRDREEQSRRSPPKQDRRQNESGPWGARPSRREPPKPKMSQEEIERRRQEMLENAKWREDQRKQNVARLEAEEAKEAKELKEGHRARGEYFVNRELRKAAHTTMSVESVLKSKRGKLQRGGGQFMSKD